MLDIIDGFISKGLNEEESFIVASGGYNKILNLREDFNKVNMPDLQMRKIIQILSGMFIFFIVYFLMLSSSRILNLK
jgi:hypothetical protein